MPEDPELVGAIADELARQGAFTVEPTERLALAEFVAVQGWRPEDITAFGDLLRETGRRSMVVAFREMGSEDRWDEALAGLRMWAREHARRQEAQEARRLSVRGESGAPDHCTAQPDRSPSRVFHTADEQDAAIIESWKARTYVSLGSLAYHLGTTTRHALEVLQDAGCDVEGARDDGSHAD